MYHVGVLEKRIKSSSFSYFIQIHGLAKLYCSCTGDNSEVVYFTGPPAVCVPLNLLYSWHHLPHTARCPVLYTYVRLLFIKFSSAFNTIIPQQPVTKCFLLSLKTPTCNWILDFLTERPQSAYISSAAPQTIRLSTGASWGCELSQLVLMSHDCTAWIQKYRKYHNCHGAHQWQQWRVLQ